METIGDCYICAASIPEWQPDHALRLAQFALGAVSVANATPVDPAEPSRGCINIRVGVHAGPVVASLIAGKYTLLGGKRLAASPPRRLAARRVGSPRIALSVSHSAAETVRLKLGGRAADTMNVASRMESLSEMNKITLSAFARRLLMVRCWLSAQGEGLSVRPARPA